MCEYIYIYTDLLAGKETKEDQLDCCSSFDWDCKVESKPDQSGAAEESSVEKSK